MNWKLFAVITVISYGAYQHFSNRHIMHGNGVIAGQQPVQAASNQQVFKHNGYTIYQASFQEDPVTKEPTMSVFSINKDPGRAIKYIGSIIFSLGIVWLFYQRRKKATAV